MINPTVLQSLLNSNRGSVPMGMRYLSTVLAFLFFVAHSSSAAVAPSMPVPAPQPMNITPTMAPGKRELRGYWYTD